MQPIKNLRIYQIVIFFAGIAIILFLTNLPNLINEPRLPQNDTLPQKYFLEIPIISVQVPIVAAVNNDEDIIQEYLNRGVVLLAGTARPGEAGNSYIVGHSSDYLWSNGQFKEIFRKLPQMKPGDEIKVFKGDKVLNFKVIETKVVENNDLSVMDQETQGKKILTLQTSYPIGTAKQRFIVISKLAE